MIEMAQVKLFTEIHNKTRCVSDSAEICTEYLGVGHFVPQMANECRKFAHMSRSYELSVLGYMNVEGKELAVECIIRNKEIDKFIFTVNEGKTVFYSNSYSISSLIEKFAESAFENILIVLKAYLYAFF
jgi:hypothetical protein